MHALQVADFGLSRQASSSTVDTDTYGTVTHMPPERLMEGKLTKSADVYAFGVLLWEMYTGSVVITKSCSYCLHSAPPPPSPPSSFLSLKYNAGDAVILRCLSSVQMIKHLD